MTSKKKLKDIVYDDIKAKIMSGEYSYEDKILDTEIAKSMDVSRMPVREALLQLQSEDFLVVTNRGFMLKRFSMQDMEHIFDVRMQLEPYAASIVAHNQNDDLVARLKPLLKAAEAAIKKKDRLAAMNANREFRSTWLALASNPRLVEIIGRLQNHVETVRIATLKFHGARVASLEFNKQLTAAFADRRPIEAEHITRLNLIDSLKFYRNIVE